MTTHTRSYISRIPDRLLFMCNKLVQSLQ